MMPRNFMHRGLLGPSVLIGCVALVGAMLAGCNLAPDVSIGGTVTSPGGARVGGAVVTVYENASETPVTTVTTSINGDYTIKNTDLPAGTYRVKVDDQWWGDGATNWASAAPVTVIVGTPKRLDVTLTSAATVTGTIVDAITHDPVGGGVAAYSGVDPVAAAGSKSDGTFAVAVPADTEISIKLLVPGTTTFAPLGGASPTTVTPPSGVTDLGALALVSATDVSAGANFTCGLNSDHTASCWGYNYYGELGDGSNSNSDVPVPVTGLSHVTDISSGYDFACAVHDSGQVSCWGRNFDGQLGNGTTTDSNTPVPVSGISDATAVTAGGFSACALHADGTVSCWGYNKYGQLGNGSNVRKSTTPVKVDSLDDATAISASVVNAGVDSVCALHTGGSISCWGVNFYGELGNGTTTSSNVPVPVSGITDATSISAGVHSACAVHTGGSISCWGINSSGQLGNGTTTSSNVPVPVSGITDATSVSAGDGAACAVHTGGTVSCWGQNGDGELGNGGTTNSSTPVPVSGITDASTVSAGGHSACALRTGGALSCWGNNANGKLGDGTTDNSLLPVSVLGVPFATVVTVTSTF